MVAPHLWVFSNCPFYQKTKKGQHSKSPIAAIDSSYDAKGAPLSSYAMADPLSVLGAAVGVTSLIIQLTDECVKGRKLKDTENELTYCRL